MARPRRYLPGFEGNLVKFSTRTVMELPVAYIEIVTKRLENAQSGEMTLQDAMKLALLFFFPVKGYEQQTITEVLHRLPNFLETYEDYLEADVLGEMKHNLGIAEIEKTPGQKAEPANFLKEIKTVHSAPDSYLQELSAENEIRKKTGQDPIPFDFENDHEAIAKRKRIANMESLGNAQLEEQSKSPDYAKVLVDDSIFYVVCKQDSKHVSFHFESNKGVVLFKGMPVVRKEFFVENRNEFLLPYAKGLTALAIKSLPEVLKSDVISAILAAAYEALIP